MVGGLIGRKVGMTQVFRDDGRAVPATVLRAGPCVVVQRRTRERDGYEAAQIGLVDEQPFKRANKPTAGHFRQAQAPPTRVVREVPLMGGEDLQPGATITCELFSAGETVDVVGAGKGRGFQGVVKRHGFRGGAAAHGSMFHRAPGSIGASAWPSRVFPGTRMGGHMGDRRVTVKRLEVLEVDAARNLLVVRGAVPGARGSVVLIRRRPAAAAQKEK